MYTHCIPIHRDIVGNKIQSLGCVNKSQVPRNDSGLVNFDFTRKKAHVIRIDIAARLILQAYELGLDGRLRGLDLRQRLAALVDVDPTKTPPKLKEIKEKEKKVFGLGRCARQP
jgi:hypothetical protein